MLKKIIITLLILVYATQFVLAHEEKSTTPKIEVLKKINALEIIQEMEKHYDANKEIGGLIDYAVVLETKINPQEFDEVINFILDETKPSEVRLAVFQSSERKMAKNYTKWEDFIYNIFENKKQDECIRIEALWLLPSNYNTVNLLMQCVNNDSDSMAFQALKRLALDNPTLANKISERIIREYNNKQIESEKLRKAIRIISKNIADGYKTNKDEFVSFCFNLLSETENQKMVNTIFFALYDIRNHEIIQKMLSIKKFDQTLIDYLLDNCKSDLPYDSMSSRSISAISSYKGYAVFRDGAGINIDWHAGLMNKANSSYSNCVIHLQKTSPLFNVAVMFDSWSGFKGNNTFRGAYKPKNVTYTSTMANNVLAKAIELTTENVQYTVTEQLTYHLAPSNGTSKGEPSDIFRIRCDGVVEYCFEYYNMIIFGQNSQYGNISIKNSHNVDYHRGGYIIPSTQAGVMTLVTMVEP